ncbi:MAG: glycosyltransferase [Chloroflexota bacterium]|nr:glycosyltransferase [Chloroflexota bacterium]
MVKRIALLHYAGPPGIGGVEAIISAHATALSAHGYPVRIIAGNGGTLTAPIETHIQPLFSSTHPDILTVKSALDRGEVPPAFAALHDQLTNELAAALSDCDVCIAHNVPTLHKNLPLTAALHTLHQQRAFKLIAWCHDFAWMNPLYAADLHDGYPWNLLRQPWAGAHYVTISEQRRDEMSQMMDLPAEQIHIIGGGLDLARFLRLTPLATQIVARLSLFAADGLLLLPARITRRKNIALALHILAALRAQSSRDWRLLVTGAPGPHNPANAEYLRELLVLRDRLQLEGSAHFLYTCGDDSAVPLLLEDEDVASLYAVADGLLFTSTQEGFGIPILEAGAAGVMIACADIPALRELAGDDALYFDPVQGNPDAIARDMLRAFGASPRYRLRVRVRQQYGWDAVIRNQIQPLLEDTDV